MYEDHDEALYQRRVQMARTFYHRQILREEAFLKKQYGGEYAAYCAKVRRYI